MTVSAVERSIERSEAEYKLIAEGDRIAVAVSGGADSVALCHALYMISVRLRLRLCVCHYNHHLRGAESDRDEAFVRAFAAGLGLEFLSGGGMVAQEAERLGLSVEEAGRRLRYAFLERCAGEGGKIATAHTMSDNAETMLFNIARGSGTRGLGGIPRRRGNVIRPLLDCSRADIECYILDNNLEYVTDSSNLSDDYSRNRIRHRAVPELKALCPQFEQNALHLAQRAAADDAYIESVAQSERERIADARGGLCRESFLELPQPVADRILLALLRESGAEISSGAVRLMRQAAVSGGAVEVAGGVFFRARGSLLRMERAEAKKKLLPTELAIPAENCTLSVALCAGKSLRLELFTNNAVIFSEKIHKQVLKNAISCDTIEKITIRARLPGDRLRLKHRGIGKSLKKLFTEEGVPESERESLAVLADGGNVIWCEGFGADEMYLAVRESRRIMLIEVVEDVL